MSRKFIKKCFLIMSFILVSFWIISCSESGGSSSTEPFADEPMIIDSVMCIDVKQEKPNGITDTFFKSDDRIYVWLYWSNVEGTSTVKALWFKPDSDMPYLEDSQVVRSESGFAITWFYLDKPVGGFSTGEWSVEIYLDDRFQRSYLFTVKD